MRTLLLCDYNNELSTEFLDIFFRNGKKIDAIVAIGDEYSRDREKILWERTGGLYKKKNFRELLSQKTIPIYISDDYNTTNTYDLLSFLKPDIIILAGTVIIRQPLWLIPSIGIINCHVALIPYFRGCSCLEWSILKDFPVGVTCHLVEKDVDAGPVLTQAILKIDKEDSYEAIRTKCIYLSGQLMLEGFDIMTNPDFHIDDLPVMKKGPWYSPMRDQELLEKVRMKIKENKYEPVFSDQLKRIRQIDVAIPYNDGN